MTSTLKRLVVEVIAGVLATIGGAAVFFLIFAWPTFTTNSQGLMLGWGWIGWIPGILAGYHSGGALRRLIFRIFEIRKSEPLTRIPNHVQCMRIHRLITIGGILLCLPLLSDILSRGAHALNTGEYISLSVVLFTVINAVVAFGAARRSPWARQLSIILGIVLLFGFPIGTLIGAYLLSIRNWHDGNLERDL